MFNRMLPVVMFAAGQLSSSFFGVLPPLIIIGVLGWMLVMIALFHHYTESWKL